ncbi:MAG TPA: radical SAM protein, partial [Steroidobacteraceae bacterium]|nr:radical SAM protein [Steroidobacteraceae bacterium]
VMQEAENLVKAGVKELLVISQDTSAYGVDLRYAPATFGGQEYQTRFLDLARGLGELGVWVRMHYVYPYPHVDDVMPLMADGRVLPYLDIPFQHGSPTVLKRMRRPAHAEDTLERIHGWRRAVPELMLRSTFIVGFPGETEQEFEELLQWLDAAQLDRVGCFRYSPVQGATANELSGAVAPEVMEERYARFMEKSALISEARMAAKVGREMQVLVDHVDGSKAVARTVGDAPEIDGVVNVKKAKGLRAGEFARVRITGAGTYDLAAEPVPA